MNFSELGRVIEALGKDRGIKKENASTVTNYFLGAFKDDLGFQNRYLRYINK